MSEQIVSIAVPRPLDDFFSYRVPDEFIDSLQEGSWVKVPFGRKNVHGYVVDSPQSLDQAKLPFGPERLKNILEVSPPELSIPSEIMELSRWASRYYGAPLGEVLNCAAPTSVLGLKNKRGPRPVVKTFEDTRSVVLNEEQQLAFDQIQSKESGVTLLEGVTGSGKTEIYIELARKTLERDQGVLILVPEIALTPQIHERFETRLGVPVGLLHSALSDGKRRDQWAALLRGDLKILIGARSAVFAPVKNLGLIVVDEEHDPSYKQEDRVRYHARDLALVRGQQAKCRVVLGSATPSLESLENVANKKYSFARLVQRGLGSSLPEIQVVDLGEEELMPELRAPFAKKTLQTIQETIDRGEQVMIFLNRRGFAAFVVCEDCGEVVECKNCSISLTLHRRGNVLRCHMCGYSEPLSETCSHCQSSELMPVGAGTESLEDELPHFLKNMKSVRLDRDVVTSAKRLQGILDDFRSGKFNVLLGTQMLVKGHDFPKVTLVVVVLADGLFRWPDFRAAERALQVLTQVSGRAGRSTQPGNVLIQTYAPDHPVLQTIQGKISQEDFIRGEKVLRQDLRYPPYGRLCRLRIEASQREMAKQRAQQLCHQLLQLADTQKLSEIEVVGPSEAFLERVKGIYRWDIVIKAKGVKPLHAALNVAKALAKNQQWPLVVDIDPNGLG